MVSALFYLFLFYIFQHSIVELFHPPPLHFSASPCCYSIHNFQVREAINTYSRYLNKEAKCILHSPHIYFYIGEIHFQHLVNILFIEEYTF